MLKRELFEYLVHFPHQRALIRSTRELVGNLSSFRKRRVKSHQETAVPPTVQVVHVTLSDIREVNRKQSTGKQ